MKAYTDYPFEELGDIPHQEAPIRECEVISYDDNKYCRIVVRDKHPQTKRMRTLKTEVKRGYLYGAPGRCGEVMQINTNSLPIA